MGWYKAAKRIVNHDMNADYPNFFQEEYEWNFGDYKRWVIDAYRVSCRYTRNKEAVMLTLNCWNWHNGIMVCEEFWKYELKDEDQAKKDYKTLQDIAEEVHERFTNGDFEEAPNSIIHRYLIKRCWEELRPSLAQTNIPHINYARQKASYEEDWRSSLYGNRYPTGESSGF